MHHPQPQLAIRPPVMRQQAPRAQQMQSSLHRQRPAPQRRRQRLHIRNPISLGDRIFCHAIEARQKGIGMSPGWASRKYDQARWIDCVQSRPPDRARSRYRPDDQGLARRKL